VAQIVETSAFTPDLPRTGFFAALRDDVAEMLGEQVQYRELLLQMCVRDLRVRYKQSVMGFGWAIFMPLINTIVFSLVFARVAKIQTSIPYPLFAYCGLAAWNFFASSLRFSVISLTTNSQLVTKVYFPREIFPFASVLVSLVDFAVSSVVLLGMMAYYRVPLTSAVWFLPIVVIVQIAFTSGMSLLLAAGNLYYRDVKYLFEVIIVVWMFATSVIYPINLIDGRLHLLMRLNPMTPIIDAYRSVLLRGELPSAPSFAAATVMSFVVLAVAWTVFHRAEFTFAETI